MRNTNIIKVKSLILFLMTMIFIGAIFYGVVGIAEKDADAYINGQTPTSVGSLTYSDYETRSDGKVFDNSVVKNIYGLISGGTNTYAAAYNAVYGSASSLSSKTDDPADSVDTQPHSMNFSQINGGNAITVAFGGFTWNIVYLTTNTTGAGGKGDLIATLWMTESTGGCHWNDYHSTTTSSPYPSSMYSTSRMRFVALNAGDVDGGSTKYATSITAMNGTRTSAQRIDNDFAQFTLSKAVIGRKSLIDYMATPSELLYQEKENWVWAYAATGKPYLLQNEAWGSPDTTVTMGGTGGWFGSGNTNNMNQVIAKPQYYDWADDYLWLPSLTETGCSLATFGTSLWGIPTSLNSSTDILKASSAYWLRSGNDPDTSICTLGTTGECETDNANATNAIRPAMHVNLTAIARELTKPQVPTGTTFTYNGNTQEIDLASFTDFDAERIKVTGITRNGTALPSSYVQPSVIAPVSPATHSTKVGITEAGTYKVTLETISEEIQPAGVTIDYVFHETYPTVGSNTMTIDITLQKKKLTVPELTSVSSQQTFGGSKLTFNLPDYPSTEIASTPSASYPRNPLSVKFTCKENGTEFTPSYVPTSTAKSDGTLDISVRDAGKYTATITIEDAVNYEWSDSTQTPKTVDFTVKPKQLSITYTSTEQGNALSWSSDSSSSKATFKIGDIYAGTDSTFPNADNVGLRLRLSKDGNSAFSSTVDAVLDPSTGKFTAELDASAFPGGEYSTGSFPITFEIAGNNTHNSNYSLTTALTGWNTKLVISASGAGLSSYTWRYTKKSGSGAIVDSDVSMPATNKLPYAFDSENNTGYVYEISVDTSEFTEHYIKIDESKYTDGIQNVSASSAGTYITKVALITLDENHLFNDNGVSSRTKEITLTWEIERGDIEISGVKWVWSDATSKSGEYPVTWDSEAKEWKYTGGSDAGLPWNGGDYTLTLSGLPTGVTVNNPTSAYTGNKKKYIGTGYTAECLGLTYDTVNYNALPSGLTRLKWSIVKGKIVIDGSKWTTSQQGEDSNIFYVPALKGVSGIEYEFYHLGTDATKPSPPGAGQGTKLDGISDIECVLGTTNCYYVKAVIASGVSIDGVTLWKDALELVDESSPEPEYGACTKYFETGDNRTPVQVTLDGAPDTYDRKGHGLLNHDGNAGDLMITVGSNAFPVSNFTIRYYKRDTKNGHDHNKGEELPEGSYPVNAGWYVIEISLTSTAGENYYATDEYLEFEIKPYVLNMSQVKWGYIDEEGNEIEYNPSKPLEYKLDEEGNGVEQKLVLIGLPKGDANGSEEEKLIAELYAESGIGEESSGILKYSGNTGTTVTGSGSNTAKCVFGELPGNFAYGAIPSHIETDADGNPKETSQSWNIEPKKIAAPKADATHTFTGYTLDILSFSGMDPKGLGIYYDLVGLTKRDVNNEAQSLFNSENCADPNNPTTEEVKAILSGIKDAGRYSITVKTRDAANVKFSVNGVTGTLPTYSAQITVNKLKIQVVDWQGDGNSPWTASYGTSEFPADIVEYRYTDEGGNVIEPEDLINHYNEQFRQTIVASAGNEDNIEIEYLDGVESEKRFLMLDQGNPPDPIAVPGEIETPKRVYTGKEQNFMPDGLEELLSKGVVKLYAVDAEGNEIETDKSYLTQKESGKYKVRVKIVGNYYWSGTNNDKSVKEYEYEIERAKVVPIWGTTTEGKPIARLPEGYPGEDVFEYKYYDVNGVEVSESELVSDTKYRVTAVLKSEYAKNYVLSDESGAEIAESEYGEEYIHPKEGLLGFLTQKFLFGLDMWMCLLIFLSILLLLILLIVFIVRRRKKKAERQAKAAEREEAEEEKRRAREEEKERREEERRRREEEREEERRRREDEREDERRRREDERRIGAQPQAMPIPLQVQQPMQMQQQSLPQVQLQQPMPLPVQGSKPQIIAEQSATEDSEMDAETYERLREYEERLRVMERELQEKRIENICREESERTRREMEERARIRRQEEEMQRLRELQDYERSRREMRGGYMPGNGYGMGYPVMPDIQQQQRELEMQRLRLLEEELRRKEIENQLLQERLRGGYAYPMYPNGSGGYIPYMPQSGKDPHGGEGNK